VAAFGKFGYGEAAYAESSGATTGLTGGTDTSNALDGRSRGGTATGTVTYPVTPVPPGRTLGERYDKAIAYPDPVMVKGRPT
jgi:hypothetical protein